MADDKALPIPKSQALTISESLSLALPELPRKKKPKKSTHTSSETTMNTDAPKIWVERPIEMYDALARKALLDSDVNRAAVENCMPSIERSFLFSSEGDITRAAAMYFLHPINILIAAKYPNVEILCLSESTSSNTRPDIVYKKKGKTFALVEYKAVGTLNFDEFENAKVESGSSKNTIQEKLNESYGEPSLTLFKENAETVMKQAANYSQNAKWKTKYVAVFDWDWLFLSIFSNEDYIHGTLIGREGQYSTQLRTSFFAWLVEAYENDGKSKL